MKKGFFIIVILVFSQLTTYSQPFITGPDMICDEGTFTVEIWGFDEFYNQEPFTWTFNESDFYSIAGGDGHDFITLKRKDTRAVPSSTVYLNYSFLGLLTNTSKNVQVGVPVLNIYMDQVGNPGSQTIPDGDFTMFVILGQPPGIDPNSYDHWEVQITGGQVMASGGTTFWVKPNGNAQTTEIRIRATDDGCISTPWIPQTYVVVESEGPPILIGE
ncbi:hypothetical protein [Ekhidna sp.]|uniref:hypothetical protein n=1 Tax=Ekhidna sp. TaxID=2608089 RepID=UPI003BACB16D